MEAKKQDYINQIKKFIKSASQKKQISLKELQKDLPSEVYYSKNFFKILELFDKKGIEIKEDTLPDAPPTINKSKSKNQYSNPYMKEMSRFSLLTEEQEIQLIKTLEKQEILLLTEISKSHHFYIHLLSTVKMRKIKVPAKVNKNPKVLKKWLIFKVLNSLEKNKVLNLKKEFKIPRSDILRIGKKIIEDTDIKEKSTRVKRLVLKIEQLQENLINSNLRLVLSIAKKYARKKNNNLFDLIQEGNLGLIKAVEMFYYHKGVRFAAYAKWWIKQSIIRSLYENNHHMKIPLHFIDAIKRLEDCIHTHVQEHKSYPSIDEMVEATKFSRKKVQRILNIISKPLSLDTPVYYKESIVELKDTIKDQKAEGPSHSTFKTMLSDNIKELLSGLSERERNILSKRYGLEDGIQRTLDEVGYYFNLTRERIRQIERKALEKLQVPSKVSICKQLIEEDQY